MSLLEKRYKDLCIQWKQIFEISQSSCYSRMKYEEIIVKKLEVSRWQNNYNFSVNTRLEILGSRNIITKVKTFFEHFEATVKLRYKDSRTAGLQHIKSFPRVV